MANAYLRSIRSEQFAPVLQLALFCVGLGLGVSILSGIARHMGWIGTEAALWLSVTRDYSPG